MSSNISNFSSVVQSPGCTSGICFGAGVLTVYLDAMVIGPDGNLPAPMGQVTINLMTTPVPEPGNYAFMTAGLLLLGVTHGKRIRARRVS